MGAKKVPSPEEILTQDSALGSVAGAGFEPATFGL